MAAVVAVEPRNIGLLWRQWGRTDGAAAPPSLRTDPLSPTAAEIGLPERPAVRADVAPVPLTMAGVLTAWRVADRALAELTVGSPEWAAVNATIISLRASYQTRFGEYIDRE